MRKLRDVVGHWPSTILFVLGILLLIGVTARGEQNHDQLARNIARQAQDQAAANHRLVSENSMLIARLCTQATQSRAARVRIISALDDIIRVATIPPKGSSPEVKDAYKRFRQQSIARLKAARATPPTRCKRGK